MTKYAENGRAKASVGFVHNRIRREGGEQRGENNKMMRPFEVLAAASSWTLPGRRADRGTRRVFTPPVHNSERSQTPTMVISKWLLLALFAAAWDRRDPLGPELLVRALRRHAATQRDRLVNELIQLRRAAEWILLSRLLIGDHVRAVSRTFCKAACDAYGWSFALLAWRGMGSGRWLVWSLILREANTCECRACEEKCRSKETVHRVLCAWCGMRQATSWVLWKQAPQMAPSLRETWPRCGNVFMRSAGR